MKCVYHNDMDGHCSAAIVRQVYLGEMQPSDFIEMDYDKDFPFDKIGINEHVIIVDFSLQKPGEFAKLLKITDSVTWIDHHKTAIERHENMVDLDGIRDTSKAACVLAWEFFYPKRKLPIIVDLLGDYDIWAFKHGDLTRNFQLGIKLFDTFPWSDNWNIWLNEHYSTIEVSYKGEIIRQYQTKAWEECIKRVAFYADFEGHRCICCNSWERRSQVFDCVDKSTYDLMFCFSASDRGWTVSLYNEKGIDGSVIAKKYGGGGHPGACGFQCKQLYFKDGKIEVVK